MESRNSKINSILNGSQQDSSGSQHGSQQTPDAANQFDARMDRLWACLEIRSDADLARILEIKQQSVSSARSRKQLPFVWVVTISEKFGISSDWILFGEEPVLRKDKRKAICSADEQCLPSEDFVLVPLLESWVRGGPDGEIIYEGISDYYPFKRWWIERLSGKSTDRQKSLFLVKVKGDSMNPTINHGEIVLVDTHEPERMQVKTGEIYLVTMPDGATAIKRLVISQDSNNRLRLVCMSDNVSMYRPFEFLLDPEKRIQDYVLGHVRWVGKEFD